MQTNTHMNYTQLETFLPKSKKGWMNSIQP